MTATEDSKALMCRITEEIWNNGRVELIDELIAEDFVDHVGMPGIDGNGRARYRASIELDAGSVYRLQNGQAAERWGITDDLAIMRQLGILG